MLDPVEALARIIETHPLGPGFCPECETLRPIERFEDGYGIGYRCQMCHAEFDWSLPHDPDDDEEEEYNGEGVA